METTTNKQTIYIVVCSIALLAIICVSTICILSYLGRQVPPELNTLAGGTVGYLAAMLVKTSPTQSITTTPSKTPSEVVVTNKPDDPVPTTETKT